MRELIAWLNASDTQKHHSVLTSAIFHHRFVSIHPFSDGNGRMARAAGVWILIKNGFKPHHILSLDEFFAENRNRYYMMIQQARKLDDDLTYWIDYVAEGAVETLKAVKKRSQSLRVKSVSDISLIPGQEEILRVLQGLFPARVAVLMKALTVSRARINQMIVPLIKAGLVVKQGESRATAYRLADI